MSFATRVERLKREYGQASAGDITVTVAANFLHGGQPTFARAFDRRGTLLTTVQRAQGEPWAAFRARVDEAGRAAGASSLLIGGLPDAIGDMEYMDGMVGTMADGMPHPYLQAGETDLPRGAVTLPEASLHPSQVEALDLIRAHRRVALVGGRRWGKSTS